MANHLTGAQRYNNRLHKVFEEARRLEKDPSTKSFRRHQRKTGMAYKDLGSKYPRMLPSGTYVKTNIMRALEKAKK